LAASRVVPRAVLVEDVVMDVVEQGHRIPGSRHYRDFCARCRAALRVSSDRLSDANYCEDCDPGQPPSYCTDLTPLPACVLFCRGGGGV